MTIESITIDNTLPRVFRDAETAGSQVWQTSLTLRRGRRYIIESASGGGKSSLCSFIYGLRRDYDGSIRFNSADIRDLSIDRWCGIRRHNLALLPQEMRLFPSLTALENVRIKNDLTHAFSEQEILEMFDFMGIPDIADKPADRISIGQQQRVAIIRTLCQPFDFILLDEPVSHLDTGNNRKAADLISRRAGQLGAGIIATSVGNHLLLGEDTINLKL